MLSWSTCQLAKDKVNLQDKDKDRVNMEDKDKDKANLQGLPRIRSPALRSKEASESVTKRKESLKVGTRPS